MISAKGHAIEGGHRMPPLPEAILLVLAPFAPLFSQRVWVHAQVLLLGAILASGPRTVTAALRIMGLALERRFTNYHRVLNRATWSARQGQSDSARAAPHGPGAPRGHDRLRCRRHSGTPVRAEDQSERLLPGCGALHQKARHPLLWLEVGGHDAFGAGALEPTSVGVALFDRTLLAQAKARHTAA